MAITLTGNDASIDETVSRMLGSVSAHLVWFGLHLCEAVVVQLAFGGDVPLPAPCLPRRLQGALSEDIPALKTFASSHIPLVADCHPLTNLRRFVYLRTSRIRSHRMR